MPSVVRLQKKKKKNIRRPIRVPQREPIERNGIKSIHKSCCFVFFCYGGLLFVVIVVLLLLLAGRLGGTEWV